MICRGLWACTYIQSASQLIHALISSRIDYCNSILYGMSDSVISDLQHIQNTAARILAKCGNSFIHSKIILKKLHWLPIKQRIVYTILITTYKAYHSIAPKYICDLITRREYKRELRTNDQMNLVVPFVKRKHFGERSFSYAAPREWNKLELSIRKSKVWNLLRKKLKPIFLKLHINKTCIDFGLLLSRIYIIMVSYYILYRVNYISIYTYVILLIIYVLSYTCISVTVSGY